MTCITFWVMCVSLYANDIFEDDTGRTVFFEDDLCNFQCDVCNIEGTLCNLMC